MWNFLLWRDFWSSSSGLLPRARKFLTENKHFFIGFPVQKLVPKSFKLMNLEVSHKIICLPFFFRPSTQNLRAMIALPWENFCPTMKYWPILKEVQLLYPDHLQECRLMVCRDNVYLMDPLGCLQTPHRLRLTEALHHDRIVYIHHCPVIDHRGHCNVSHLQATRDPLKHK